MRDLKNVVDFAELCLFAEKAGIAHYNMAHEILDKDFYPDTYGTFQVDKLDVDQYTDDTRAIDILTKFMEAKGVEYVHITV